MENTNGKNWADILGLVAMILAIINILVALLGLIPLLGLPLRILGTIGGVIYLVLSIVACIFCKSSKAKPIAGIVLSSVSVAISLPLWIVYVVAPK